ncbi:GDSL-type esterase/lipase family protein [Streptomyces sp. NPDC046465]|uniref:GDSL-type esterase/lipase family protein n=1 Tax=Streptomyces sp. NPDC046465 TaxID=3155810 RepID=UPI0033FACFCB
MRAAPREFTRGVAWWSPDGAPVRADPSDRDRLPGDTWQRAGLPAGIRLEFTAHGVRAVEITYTASAPSPPDAHRAGPPVFTLLAEPYGSLPVRTGEPGAGGGSPAEPLDTAATPPAPGRHICSTQLQLPHQDGDFTLHLPETLHPVVHDLRPLGGGTVEPAARRPRWLVHGDSITEGWSASRPHLTWPALAGRAMGLDTVNLGYAGAARGELATAEQLAALDADALTVAFGTNCWSRTPHSSGLLYETTLAFLRLVRRGHPRIPLLVVSPVLRPDAESVPNALGATLAELRAAVERAALDAGSALLPGGGLLAPGLLVDGVHPGDAGHRALADAVVSALPRGQSWAGQS